MTPNILSLHKKRKISVHSIEKPSITLGKSPQLVKGIMADYLNNMPTKEIALKRGLTNAAVCMRLSRLRQEHYDLPKRPKGAALSHDPEQVKEIFEEQGLATATQMMNALHAKGIRCSLSTTMQWLEKYQYCSISRPHGVPLSDDHKRARKEMAMYFLNNPMMVFSVVFSDETAIGTVLPANLRSRMYLPLAKKGLYALVPQNDYNLLSKNSSVAHMFGCSMYPGGFGLTGAYGDKIGAKEAQEYIHENLLVLNSYNFDVKKGFLAHDNVPCFKAASTKKYLMENGISVIKWPANSPDLNPIEEVFGCVKARIRRFRTQHKDANVYDLFIEAWEDLDPKTAINYYRTFNLRMLLVLLADGGRFDRRVVSHYRQMVDAGKEVQAREEFILHNKVPQEFQHYLENIIPSKDENLTEKLKPSPHLWHSRVSNFDEVFQSYLKVYPRETNDRYNDKLLFEYYQRWWALQHAEGGSSDSDVSYFAAEKKNPVGRPPKVKKKLTKK